MLRSRHYNVCADGSIGVAVLVLFAVCLSHGQTSCNNCTARTNCRVLGIGNCCYRSICIQSNLLHTLLSENETLKSGKGVGRKSDKCWSDVMVWRGMLVSGKVSLYILLVDYLHMEILGLKTVLKKLFLETIKWFLCI